ncbi:unnamed protein product [Alopecurus aequalis]
MAFAGVSLIVDGQLCDSTSSPFDAAADSGYHLFVVEGARELLDGHRELEDGVHLDGDLELEDEVNFDMGMVRHVLERSKHMKNESFTIRCDVAVVKNIEEQGVGSMENHFGNPLLSMECSDITFEVGGKEFAAHRCVLAARSAVFKAQLVGAMDEGATAPSVVKINGIDADVFERLLTFIYTGAISEFKKYANEETARLLELLEAADRYELHSLKSICEEILASRYIHPPTHGVRHS